MCVRSDHSGLTVRPAIEEKEIGLQIHRDPIYVSIVLYGDHTRQSRFFCLLMLLNARNMVLQTRMTAGNNKAQVTV